MRRAWVAACVFALLATACGSPLDTGFPREGAAPEVNDEQPPASNDDAPPPGDEARVEVGDNWYESQEITVAAGTTVVWSQTGSAPHTVTADDESFDSHPDCPADLGACMRGGDRFEWTFDEPGSYGYFCKLHGRPEVGQYGTVVVEG